MTDKEWEERQKTRQLEMEAVSEALAVPSGDDAHDLFTRTFSPALLQVDRQDARQTQASPASVLSLKFGLPGEAGCFHSWGKGD